MRPRPVDATSHEPTSAELQSAIEAFAELALEHAEQERDVPVRRPLSPEEIQRRLDLDPSTDGRPLAEVVEELRTLLSLTPSTASASFFNQLFGGRDPAALLGELLAAVLNSSMYTYKVGGPQVLIELALIRRMGALMGLSEPDGIFAPGGSLSNLAALALARDKVCPDAGDRGLDGRVLRIYTSADSHYSITKAAVVLGIGRDNVVRVAVDARGRMDPAALDRAIVADREAGLLPCAINATAGTTVLGAYDPLEPIAAIARQHDLWLHVDAAYGGGLIFHPKLRDQFAGSALADSITWDAHKMMGVPLTCSVLLVRERGPLTRALSAVATYLFQDDTDDLNPGTRSLQCGRRNDTLKLWSAWRHHGDAGYRARMIRLRELALYARDRVVADPALTLVREPESLNICFEVDGVRADALCTALNRTGRAMVGHAFVDERLVVRLVTLDPAHTTQDIDAFFEALRETAAELRAAEG